VIEPVAICAVWPDNILLLYVGRFEVDFTIQSTSKVSPPVTDVDVAVPV
jgi:hypothetical protein